ncbi:hypothetical protein LC040_02085 [Bacillus tianshenii]|nr:hypothetical protein LC040_02085 [Bacillus tianshenii]
MMKLIASQPYVYTTRVIEYNEQHVTEREEMIDLYEEKLTTPLQQFHLKEVFDMSHRIISAEYGFLYLHTCKGVFSFNVTTSPQAFIQAYKQLKSN